MPPWLGYGFIFLVGLFFQKLLSRTKLPAVTAYLLSGIVLGPQLLNLLPKEVIKGVPQIGILALSIVAFQLGEGFEFHRMKKVGRSVFYLSWAEVLGAYLVVLGGSLLLGLSLPLSLLLASLAPASAPVAIFMVVRESRVKGKFTNLLLNILAIDDAWSIILFSFTMSVVGMKFYMPKEGNGWLIYLGKEILGGIGLGVIVGVLFSIITKWIHREMELLVLTLGGIFLCTGICEKLGVSFLLGGISFGTTYINLTKNTKPFEGIRKIDWLIYLLFFVLSGASMEFHVVIGSVGLCIIYIVTRMVGLFSGAYLGGKALRLEKGITNWIGLCLFTQAGVALSQAMIIKHSFPEIGRTVFNMIIATTIFFEIIGPILTQVALKKCKE